MALQTITSCLLIPLTGCQRRKGMRSVWKIPLYRDKCYTLHKKDHRLAGLFDYTLFQIFSKTYHQCFFFSLFFKKNKRKNPTMVIDIFFRITITHHKIQLEWAHKRPTNSRSRVCGCFDFGGQRKWCCTGTRSCWLLNIPGWSVGQKLLRICKVSHSKWCKKATQIFTIWSTSVNRPEEKNSQLFSPRFLWVTIPPLWESQAPALPLSSSQRLRQHEH